MNSSVYATIGFGLVSIPVGVSSAVATTNEVKFRQLHDCGSEIKVKESGKEGTPGTPGTIMRQNWCESCGVAVETTVRGYEVTKGEFITITDEEFEATRAPLSKEIQLRKFVPVGEILPIMVEKSYFLLPHKNSPDRYGLLYQTLAKLKVAGIGSESLWQQKEHPCAIVPDQSHAGHAVLMMHVLRLHEDIVVPDFTAPIPTGDAGSTAVKKIAADLVTGLKSALDPETDLVSSQRLRLQELVASKINGETVRLAVPVEAVAPPDLMEALKASMPKTKTKA